MNVYIYICTYISISISISISLSLYTYVYIYIYTYIYTYILCAVRAAGGAEQEGHPQGQAPDLQPRENMVGVNMALA